MQTKLHRILFILIFLIVIVFAASCQAQELPPAEQEQPIPEASATLEPSATPEPTATPTEAPTPTPTETPLPNPDQARTTIIQGLLALNSQPNRMTVTTTLEGGQTSTNIIEFVPPDRKRIISPEVDMEYVIIGDMVYMKVAGLWVTAQIPAATFMGEAVTEAMLTATVSEPQFLRLAELDGQVMMVYGYQSTTLSGGIELHSQVELWVGLADGLIYQMITEGETLSVSTDASGQSVSLAVPALNTTLIEYDDAISIEPPIP
jgi:hypothetical protein